MNDFFGNELDPTPVESRASAVRLEQGATMKISPTSKKGKPKVYFRGHVFVYGVPVVVWWLLSIVLSVALSLALS